MPLSSDRPSGQTPTDAPPIKLWMAHCPFAKDGAPVLGNFGSRIKGVIIIEVQEWTRLLERVPELATMQFDAGEFQ